MTVDVETRCIPNRGTGPASAALESGTVGSVVLSVVVGSLLWLTGCAAWNVGVGV